jgi:hypothetical protein
VFYFPPSLEQVDRNIYIFEFSSFFFFPYVIGKILFLCMKMIWHLFLTFTFTVFYVDTVFLLSSSAPVFEQN